ncbi:MAG: hypothetical protein NTY09_08935 [bacterium]|nr:hypothetical protein [bacterium]
MFKYGSHFGIVMVFDNVGTPVGILKTRDINAKAGRMGRSYICPFDIPVVINPDMFYSDYPLRVHLLAHCRESPD